MFGGRLELRSTASGDWLLGMEGRFLYRKIGTAVAPAGDLDGDGVPDLLVGGWDWDTPGAPGYVEVRSGADGKLLREHWASTIE